MKRSLESDYEQYDYSAPIKVSGGYVQVHKDGFKYYFDDTHLDDVQPYDQSNEWYSEFTIKINDVVCERIKWSNWDEYDNVVSDRVVYTR
jgi:hypothetical protein